MKEGEISSTAFRINNFGSTSDFEIVISGVEGKISLSEENFQIESGNQKEVKVYFNDTSLGPDVYVGSLIIKNSLGQLSVPVILEIQSRNPFFAVNIEVTPKYKEIGEGGETFSQINFFNLKDKEIHPATVNYEIIGLDGVVLSSETDDVVLGSQSSTAKNTQLPQEAIPGSYIYTVVLKSEGTTSTSSYIFDVVSKKTNLPFGLDINSFFSFIVIVILIFIFFLIIYILYERSRLFNELKNQQKSELRTSSEIIDVQKDRSLQKVTSDKEREKILTEFKEAKEKILKELKEIQKHHRREFEQLNKKEDKKVLEKKLTEWKKGAYSKAVKKAKISNNLKQKLGTLKKAYEQGYISKESYEKGQSRIKSVDK